ncbi:MAG: bifunctional (p)ppGpp synthetase/guanosine-3',5'-bis(diphosphate) 3'-pyrophosphohydrolase [Myxococcales bacterium]|nr:bifunctional (p)ppGpp synthetase/guanosine-3',5'-bis(diphosphate) 3'-pyrophosphohydrolase [Myxococcales bacterium]
MLDRVRSYQPRLDDESIRRAYRYAERMHLGQLRKSGEPYFTHPLAVAGIIAEMRLDATSVCAALLHDVLEDTAATEEELVRLFGREVAFLVDGVTKLGRYNFANKEDQQAESFRKMLVAMARDIRVLLVKLADRLDNMRTLDAMSPDAQERIARETLEIYAPLAGRLGIQWIKAELEDLSFRHLHPEAYRDLRAQLKKQARDRERYIADVSRRLHAMLAERGFAVEVHGRVKHLYSVWRKMRDKGLELDQIHDLVAFRVIVEDVADCYAALGVVHAQWTPVPGRFKDYVALAKPNLYQSLHTTVLGPGHRRIEIQIRTREMHRTAEYGVAAHWRYKERSGGLDPRDAARFAWLRQLMEFQKEVPDPAEFLETIKGDLVADEVYVFTPRGDVKILPRNATPVDFAYAVHSEVGHHCAGARVNGVMVPLRHVLRNGDVVEILTNTAQHPSKDWLEFVVSSRARSRIRQYVRAEERRRSIELGRDLVEREMHRRDLSLQRWLKNGEPGPVLSRFRVQSVEELFALVGIGKLGAQDVVAAIAPPDDTEARETFRPSLIERTVRKVTGRDGDAIVIDGHDDVLVRFARCCNPVPGDLVTGWITRGRGVTVHRRGCARAMELDPERRIEVSWGSAPQVALPVQLRVTTADRPGILANVSAAFTQCGVNISEATCRTSPEGRAVNLFQFTVGNLKKLREVMRAVQRVDGVYEVERV